MSTAAAHPGRQGQTGARPAPMVLLYDGRCGFCTAQSRRLVRLARPGAVSAVDAHAPGALDRHGGGQITLQRAMAAVQLVAPAPAGRPGQPRIFEGSEAVVRVLATRPGVGLLAHAYYIPVVRWACDALYAWIAPRRYRISRWWPGGAAEACETGACGIDRPR